MARNITEIGIAAAADYCVSGGCASDSTIIMIAPGSPDNSSADCSIFCMGSVILARQMRGIITDKAGLPRIQRKFSMTRKSGESGMRRYDKAVQAASSCQSTACAA